MMIHRKYIEQNHSLYLVFITGAIMTIMFNYLVVFFGIEVFIFERLTEKVYEYSTKLYLYAKITTLIATGILFLQYNSKKSFEIESNNKGLLLSGLLFINAIAFLVIYLLSTAMPVDLYRLTTETVSFFVLFISLHFFIRVVNSLDYEDNAPISDILKPAGSNIKSDYYFEVVEPLKTIIPIPDMYRSTITFGGAGTGKTASIIKPRIAQTISANKASLLCYDPKSPELTNMIAGQLDKHNRLDKLRIINFLNPQHLINPIDPNYIKHDEVVFELARVLSQNLDLEGETKFWRNNFEQYVIAVILFLKYKHPEYCTIPHVISIMLDLRITTIISMCETVQQAVGKIAPVKVAIGYKIDKDDENAIGGSQNQTAGVIGTVCTSLNQLDSEKIFFTFSGNDFNLKINEAENQSYITLANHSELQSTLRAPIALIISTIIRLNNVDAKPGENRIGLHISFDEFNTAKVPNIESVASTGRSRKMMFDAATQDISLMYRDYGEKVTEVITSSCGNINFGNTGSGATLKKASNMIGKRDVVKKTSSKSKSSSNYSENENKGLSKTENQKLVIEPHEISLFKEGEFLSKIIGTEKVFYKFRTKYTEYPEKEHPELYKGKYDKKAAMWLNYLVVKAEANQLISDYEIKLNMEKNPNKSSTLHKGKREKIFNY